MNEKELTSLLTKIFSSGEKHYALKAPSDPQEYRKLISILDHLEYTGVCIHFAHDDSQYEYIDIEQFPPCSLPQSQISQKR